MVTLAWGVNFPTHLVIVRGTEYYDAKTQRYVDYPITDVLQMMRCGSKYVILVGFDIAFFSQLVCRPQYDDCGVAAILVHDAKKHFYKKYLYEPFQVDSR